MGRGGRCGGGKPSEKGPGGGEHGAEKEGREGQGGEQSGAGGRVGPLRATGGTEEKVEERVRRQGHTPSLLSGPLRVAL